MLRGITISQVRRKALRLPRVNDRLLRDEEDHSRLFLFATTVALQIKQRARNKIARTSIERSNSSPRHRFRWKHEEISNHRSVLLRREWKRKLTRRVLVKLQFNANYLPASVRNS